MPPLHSDLDVIYLHILAAQFAALVTQLFRVFLARPLSGKATPQSTEGPGNATRPAALTISATGGKETREKELGKQKSWTTWRSAREVTMADFYAFLRSSGAYLISSAEQFPTNGFDGTKAIGLSFIFLAYVWHPMVGWTYHRMRAYRAWRAIEKRQAVEVTSYPTMTEVFGRQGMCAWDAARIITLALLAFNLASWGLELNMDLYALDNRALLLTLPPPVHETDSTWVVSPLTLSSLFSVSQIHLVNCKC